jgi:hypothetical protein
MANGVHADGVSLGMSSHQTNAARRLMRYHYSQQKARKPDFDAAKIALFLLDPILKGLIWG